MSGSGRELELRAEIAAKCRSCGACRSVCPIFAEVGLEASVARGKVALIKAALDGEIPLSSVFDEKIQLCLNCKACVAECPNAVRVDDLVLAARSGLVEAGRLPFLKRFIFRQLLKRGRLLPPFGRVASFVQRVVLRGLPKESALRKLLPVVGIDRNRVFPQFAPRAFLATVPRETPIRAGAAPPAAAVGVAPPATGAGTAAGAAAADREARRRIAREARRVGYFVGCATNLIYPETGKAIVAALERAGVEVVAPRAQFCCGTPVFNAGDFVTGRELARKNIAAFKAAGVDAVVTGCASCGLTLKREYQEMLGIAGGFGIPVFDFAEFLALRGFVPPRAEGRERIRVTFHDPCHLVRGQGIRNEPREILRALPWVEFVEMRDADRCCGSGGTFSLTHYDLSKAIAKRKIEAIRDAHVDVVATECPSCVMQLRDMLEQAGMDVAVVSVADLIALGGLKGGLTNGPAGGGR